MKKPFRFLEAEKKGDTEPPALIPGLGLTLLVETVKPQKNGKNQKKLNKKSKIKLAAGLAALTLALLWGVFAKAQASTVPISSVPRLINFQSVLTDIGGVPLVDGFHNVQFRLLDVNKEPIYTETQNLESVGGVVSAMVGAQDYIDLELFAPDQAKFLGVKPEGSTPETLMEIVSVPYSMYAEQALTVADSVTQDILSKITADVLPQNVVYSEQLSDSTGAGTVGIATGNFSPAVGSPPDVQGALEALDKTITTLRSDLENQVNNKVSKAGDVMSGVLNMGGNKIVSVGTPSDNGDVATKAYVDQEISTTKTYIDNKVSGNITPDPPTSSAPVVVAAGIVDKGGSGFQLVGGYQVSGISVGNVIGGPITISLGSSVSPPYIVQVTPSQSSDGSYSSFPSLYVQNLSSSSFQVAVEGGTRGPGITPFHFVVYK
ncbi:MAG: hypothetical protein A3F82_10175 [Deltaproteobacteria bacterium RIFCSPLOWO2_12_FULL_44_12]|nr:MAG: hypothetical protein A2712_00155 [Deltaproteobacteria bacterium RIFCSPHIGHO2_01_FULL_43_49]OGQ15831.1 MAG: hypothetical protein A3D22_02805 [Deltaproteobacteria bacterium RIFCSPHIGHO2_02_FULL_44_53]OGQ28785.1 MAG: hypothetical protein A3D98_01135 [Deltaproteobacteria bacterium RIFCSPHIGHO2_12_FULL_44_21]OGQ32105.1 MAG: hypothetical protein A2979_03260 [Deltaproteobacteria bacterium RIFCSPLOWO2_01_FULL_45_74]OGQ43752.1 MAG: hypothetical protein A3I70_05730 [Deltaproteobacteria bacterium 